MLFRCGLLSCGWLSQDTWDDGNPDPMEGLFWESPHHKDEDGNPQPTTMTPEQINAAKLLGHTTETWNHGMTQDDAATKIAANFRGKKTRREFVAKVICPAKLNAFLFCSPGPGHALC